MSAEQDLANANVQIANLIAEVTRFRDAAMGINNIWPTITEGRQNTADGKYFSVPGNGAYMRLYRRAGSSQTLIAEFPDRAEMNSVIDQLGPLLGRGVVGGSGNLMAEGFAGVGVHIGTLNTLFSSDFNTFNNFCGSGTTSGSWSNGPLGNGTHTGILVQEVRSVGNSVIQWWINQLGYTPQVYRRTGRPDQGTWFPWQRTYDSGNILGTVSQSGGVPTGAIIERGSNANGEYVKFADGALICFSKIPAPSGAFSPDGALFSTPPVSLTFPASFVSSPVVSLGAAFGAIGAWAGLGDSGTTNSGTSIRAYRTSAATVSNLNYDVLAIGRWY